MNIPILALTPESVRSPTRLDLAIVENLMIWPDDEAAREKAMRTAEVQFGRDLLDQGRLPDSMVRDLARQAVDTTAPADVSAIAKERFMDGLIAGTILYRAILYREIKPDQAAIEHIVAEISQRLFPKWRRLPKTIRNTTQKKFRSVAHFWASYITTALLGRREGLLPAFPCRLGDLRTFLAVADEFRKLGETTRRPRAPKPVVVPGTSVMISSEIDLPPITLRTET